MGQDFALQSPAAARTCVFCGSPNPAETELWPSWLDEIFPETASPRLEDLALPGGSGDASPRPRLVCATCRGGWIESLGEKARLFMDPLMHGERVELAVDQIKVLSGCLCLVAMKAACLTRHCGIGPGDRAHLRHTGQPPKNWSIFVATLSSGAWSKSCLHQPFRIEFRGNPLTTQSRDHAIKETNTQLLSIGMGPLFFHIFNSPSLLLLNDFNIASRKHGLTPLWPISRRFGFLPPAAVRLPPETLLTEVQARELADAFATGLHSRLPDHCRPAAVAA